MMCQGWNDTPHKRGRYLSCMLAAYIDLQHHSKTYTYTYECVYNCITCIATSGFMQLNVKKM